MAKKDTERRFLYRPARKAGRYTSTYKERDQGFYTDPLVRRVSEVVQTASQIEGNGLVKSAIFGVGCSITLSL